MPFADYALTMDLLESELVNALAEQDAMGAAATRWRRPALPLRDAYLPSVLHALDVERRVCAGGPVALLAAARPGGAAGRRQADYALLVQERSPRVLNAVGRLAVIPKAFHQPTVEPAAEADLSTSLQRELEEELLGREELGSLFGRDFRKVDPLHADLLSPPLRWLLEHQDSDSYRIECVGFGINLLSGNYEFACLILIDDEEWWRRFGSLIEANWEIERIRLYSSCDTDGLRELMLDPRWSSEGLFAFSQGLRRLAELDSAPTGRRTTDRSGGHRWLTTGTRATPHTDGQQHSWLAARPLHGRGRRHPRLRCRRGEVGYPPRRRGPRRLGYRRAAHPLLLLIRGRFRLDLSVGSVTLEREGDYAVWGPGIDHCWQAEEDSIVITVRWPSIPST